MYVGSSITKPVVRLLPSHKINTGGEEERAILSKNKNLVQNAGHFWQMMNEQPSIIIAGRWTSGVGNMKRGHQQVIAFPSP